MTWTGHVQKRAMKDCLKVKIRVVYEEGERTWVKMEDIMKAALCRAGLNIQRGSLLECLGIKTFHGECTQEFAGLTIK